MDEAFREKFVQAAERAVLKAGAENYEVGLSQAKRLISWINDGIQSMETRDDLRAVLTSAPPVGKKEAVTVLFILRFLPQIIRYGLKFASKKAASTLPVFPAGRPAAIAAAQVKDALDHVSSLYRKGCEIGVAQERTAQRFGCDKRTIERLWAKRASISGGDEMATITVDEAFLYLTQGKASINDNPIQVAPSKHE